MNNATPEEKQAVFASLTSVERAMYADADAKDNFLDGIYIQQKGVWLTYTHPEEHDLFMGEQWVSGRVRKFTMPSIIVFYADW